MQEVAVLLRDKREPLDSDNAYPTHIAILEVDEKSKEINKIKSKIIVKLEDGKPVYEQNSFRVTRNTQYLKILGCKQQVALEFYEEAATRFFLCWDGKSYGFYRDPTDEP
ncbi:MAG: hypothetical protein ABTQ34_05070 [Bdellovibrionales bacterium]